MTIQSPTVAVIGAGGKMGMRLSANLEASPYSVLFAETHPAAQARVQEAGRRLTDGEEAAVASDVVILAVPDVVLDRVSAALVPLMRPGAVVMTLDPAAAHAGVLAQRADITYACAHPCHPSVFCHRTTEEEHADSFGGVAAPQDVVAALDQADDDARQLAEGVIRTIYGPVLDVHWVTVAQLASLEPTLVETVACMVGGLLAEALQETVETVGVPEAAARAMLLGHIQIALTNTLQGAHTFSDGCMIAMGYGREMIVKPDWKRIFDPAELDRVLARMLRIDAVRRDAQLVQTTE
ncbi:MAG TPA: phosphogluconate dehydrogenase C-terminal domain-containing protein [Acidimicrobiales bacterium]|nr:phosphogluconate dehydrogenase C-terminal domain-containing protein [Acidimicrobiales bacterium]